jgi:hypothetical protein
MRNKLLLKESSLDENSLTDELSELTKQYDDLNNKIETLNKKISARKSIQASLGLFGVLLFLFSLALFAVIILTLVLDKFDQLSNLFLFVISALVIIWIAFFVISRINLKSFSSNSIQVNSLSKQLKETKQEIDKTQQLIEKEKQNKKQQKTTQAPETQEQAVETNQTEKPYKFVGRLSEEKWGTETEVAEWKKEDEQTFEEEQKKKGLEKFVPVSLQIRELMSAEGHSTEFMSKFPNKWKKSEDIPSEITWGTPEQVFEWKQKEKGLIKFVDSDGKTRWGTDEQVAEWQKEKNTKA